MTMIPSKNRKLNWIRRRFIAGLTLDQTAQALGIADRTVSKHWNYARAFVRRELERVHGPLGDDAAEAS